MVWSSAVLLVPCPFRHEQLQAQRASVEAQEVALLVERERLMKDGHRQRGMEDELRRLQNEHDRYLALSLAAVCPSEVGWLCLSLPCCGFPGSNRTAVFAPKSSDAAGRSVSGARGAAG